MGISQDKTSSRLWLLVFFLLGVAVTFVVLRLGDVGFQRPMNPGPWSPPYPDPRPPPSDTPRPEPVTFHPVATTPPRPASTAPVTKPPRRVVDMRLPRDIWPKHYNLSLKVFLPGYGVSIPPEQQYEFIGQVILTFENEKPLKRIVLNQRNLGVIQYSLTTETGDTIPITKVVTQDNFEFVIFELAKYLQPGTHQLYVEYKGNMKNNKEAGLYLSRDSPSRENRFVAMTDMEPFDARAMMTCLDEPEYKSVWKVFVTHPKESMALANEIDEYVRKMGDWKMTSFEETPIMSSYLVAIFVGNYSYVEDYTARGLRTKWSLEVAVKAMDTYEKLFDIPYPMKKLDQLFSTDFSSGAMENWGLVTYRPEALLYLDDGDYDQKLNVALVVAHELGHQWFGNLVTTAWWSQLWLNEGWATFLEFIGTEKAYNSTISEFRYYLATIREAMKADYMYGRPMTYEVTYQEEIKGAMFDDVTYQKGAALITMLKELLGTQIFDEAVRNYLKKYQYKSTNQQDLFGEFDAVIPEDKLGPDGKRLNVTHFGLQYTMQKGIPMVSLAPHNTTHSRLSQRMITNKTNKNPRYDYSPYGFKWDVPIYVQRGEDGREFYWMSAGRDLFIPSSASETLIVNADSYVYSLVNYTESQWIAIARSLKKNHTMFSEQARTKLIHDMHAFGLYKKLYQLLDEYPFKSENDYLPFATFLKSSREMEDTYGPQLKDSMAKYMKTGLEARVKTMDIRETVRRIVDAKTYNQERLSLLLYIEYCRLAPAECQNDLSEMFKDDFLSKCKEDQMASKCSAVLPELRQLVYCAGVQSRGDEVTKMLIKMRSVEQWAAESERLLIAGLCSHDKKFVWKSLASIGVEAPSKTSSLLVDNGLGSRIVADYTIDNLLEEKPIYERRAPSRHGVSRKFRQFGRNEAMEKMRKAISKAVDRAQKMREDVDVGRGRQLAEELDRKTRQLAFL